MPQVKKLELVIVNYIGPIRKDRSFNRGNGRRLGGMPEEKRAKIPHKVRVMDVATHEVEFPGSSISDALIASTLHNPYGERCNKIINLAEINTAQGLLIHLGKAESFPRPSNSKVLWYANQAYGVMTWTDFFGASIKECEAGFPTSDGRIVFLKLIDHSVWLQLEAAVVADAGTLNQFPILVEV